MALQGKRPFGSNCFNKAAVLESDVNDYGGMRSTIRSKDGSYG